MINSRAGCQRALIASAIVGDPALLISDEPTTALDLTVLRERIAGGVGVLLISHDLALVARIADHVHVIREGRVVEAGTARDVSGRPNHPYTRQLLAAVPSIHSRGTRLAVPRDNSASTRRDELSPRVPLLDDMVLEARGLTRHFARTSGEAPFTALDEVRFSLRR